MNSLRKTRRRSGFTLVELLAASAMLAALAGSLYACLHVAFRARRTALESTEATRRLTMTMSLLDADIRPAVVPNGILAGSFYGASQSELGQTADSLDFYSAASADLARTGTGDVRRVELLCEDQPKGLLTLKRLVTSNLLSPIEQAPYEEILCRDVRTFRLRYFDGTEWLESWDSSAYENTLPLAVEVTLEIVPGGPGGYDEQPGLSMTRVILLSCGQNPADATADSAEGGDSSGDGQ